jgi:anti-anti-sigma regulatory factor
MLKPSVEVKERHGMLLAEFWDCLRLDPTPVRDLRLAYERHMQQGGKPTVIIDLRGVGFAGSAALGGFVALRKLGCRVIFHGVEPTVREVFRVSHLESMFQFANDEAEALQAAAAASADSEPNPSAPTNPPSFPRSTSPLSRRSRRDKE